MGQNNQHTNISKTTPSPIFLDIYKSHKYRLDNYINCLFKYDFMFGFMLGFIPDVSWNKSKSFCETFEKYFEVE